jgi:hypothetical protein
MRIRTKIALCALLIVVAFSPLASWGKELCSATASCSGWSCHLFQCTNYICSTGPWGASCWCDGQEVHYYCPV